MDQDTLIIFLVLIFGAVFLLTQSIVAPTFGTDRQESKRLQRRLKTISEGLQTDLQASLIREKYFKKLSPLENRLESMPGMYRLEAFIERAGHVFPAYQLVLMMAGFAFLGGLMAWFSSQSPIMVVCASGALAWLPYLKLKMDLGKRFLKFEEQLPEALDVMTRALRAGYPFNETLHLVGTEMEDPIAREFRIAFDEINFGVDMQNALRDLVDRMPSLSLMAIVTTVLVQRETGGNLAETFENISRLIRNRFKFYRRVRTLTAEARMSSLILVLSPFVLFAGMNIVNPDYVSPLIHDPLGHKLLGIGLALIVIGNLWIRKLISIKI